MDEYIEKYLDGKIDSYKEDFKKMLNLLNKEQKEIIEIMSYKIITDNEKLKNKTKECYDLTGEIKRLNKINTEVKNNQKLVNKDKIKEIDETIEAMKGLKRLIRASELAKVV